MQFSSEPYLAFSTTQCENYTSFWKRIEVWLNHVIFKVIDISMKTIYQKIGNR